MAWYSWLIGGSDTANKLIDNISSGVDAAFYTDEEKAQAQHKILEFKLRWVQATSGQNLARRIIAIAVTALWALIVLLAVFLVMFGQPSMMESLFKILAEVVSTPFSIIIGFYFLANIVRSAKNG